MNKINKLNFLRFLSYLEEGYTFYEIRDDFFKYDLVDVVFDCLKECNEEQLIGIIWFLVCESMYYAVYDIAEILDVEEKEMYWL